MKDEITSLDLYYMMKELVLLENARTDKIYQNDKEFLFTFHKTGDGKKLLKIRPNNIFFSEYKEEYPDAPPGFCKFLRKHLSNTRLRSISQKGFERILELRFEGKEKELIMIIELFGNGNIILCDAQYKIMSSFHSKKWRERIVRGGITYEVPPVQNNILNMDEDVFSRVIDESEHGSIVKILAIDFNLGGLYSEEICHILGIDKNNDSVSNNDKKCLYNEIKKFISQEPKPIIVSGEILPFALQTINSDKVDNFETLSQAIDSKLSNKLKNAHIDESDKKKNQELERVKLIIENQELTIKNMSEGAEDNQKKGELIYENYDTVKEILEEINKARNKLSWDEIKERVKGHKLIKNINEKEGKITIEL